MELEQRGDGVYYYTSRRVGRRLEQLYGGSCYLATLSARMNDAQRENL